MLILHKYTFIIPMHNQKCAVSYILRLPQNPQTWKFLACDIFQIIY